MFLTQNVISQSGSSFSKGFNNGFTETLRDAGILGNYLGYGDSRKCERKNIYVNDPKAEEKLYADGYRCGVQQATKAIPQINKADNARQTQKNKGNAETNLQVRAYNKALENQKKQEQYYKEQAQKDKLRKERDRIENQQYAKQREASTKQALYDSQQLYQLQQRQIQSQNYYNQQVSNTLNSLSNSLQAVAYQNVKKEINRRQNIANNFAKRNSNRIEKLTTMYNNIPKNNFKRVVNGSFSANLFIQRKYSFVNNQELVTEIPCLVKVVDGRLTELYPYGKKGFELEYPKNYSSQSTFSNGIVKYSNYETLETITIVLIEPYLSDNPKQYGLNEKGTGFVTVWTSKKDDKGKTIFIQELDNRGNIVREVPTKLVYAKNEKELKEMDIKPIAVNTDNEIHYFGEPTQTPYGVYPLYPKTSKSNQKPLSDNEVRLVQIKKYRE